MTLESVHEGDRTTVVVYERATGDIVHIHEVLTERGGRHPTQKAIEAAAVEYALEGPRGRQLSAKAVAALQLNERFEALPEYDYRVDVKTRQLVRSPVRPKPGRGNARR